MSLVLWKMCQQECAHEMASSFLSTVINWKFALLKGKGDCCFKICWASQLQPPPLKLHRFEWSRHICCIFCEKLKLSIAFYVQLTWIYRPSELYVISVYRKKRFIPTLDSGGLKVIQSIAFGNLRYEVLDRCAARYSVPTEGGASPRPKRR